MSITTGLREKITNRKARQALSLYLSLFIGLFVSICVSSINTHALGSEQFGDFKFIQTFSVFIVTIISFGFYAAGGRLLAITDDLHTRRQLLSGLITITFINYLFFVFLLWLFSFYFDLVFERDLAWLIRLTLPLVFIYPLNICLENTLKGLNAIYFLAVIRTLPNIMYLGYAYCLSYYNSLDLYMAYRGYLIFSAVIYLMVVLYLKADFYNVKYNIIKIYEETKRYGFKVYTGILASVATMHLGGVMVAYYLDTKMAGFFLLARTITLPLTQISTTIGITLFRHFASSQRIDSKIFIITAGIAFFLLGFFYVVIDELVGLLYPPEFKVITPLCLVMASGSTLQGIGGMINNFVCAQGYGAYSRNASFIRGLVNVGGYTAGIYYFGVNGAALTVLVSGTMFLFTLLVYYRKIIWGQV